MADQRGWTVRGPLYTGEDDPVNAAEDEMSYWGSEEQRQRKFPERLGYSSADIGQTHKRMQEAAEEGMRLRRARKALRQKRSTKRE